MPKTVLVTGGTGFVGSWCIVELLERGYMVRTTIRTPAREADVRRAVASQVDPGDRLGFAIADLTTDDGWAEAMAGVDHVLHVASPLGREAPRDRDALVAPARDGTLVAIFQPRLRMFRHDLGQRREVDHSKASRILDFHPRPARETLVDCAESLIARQKAAA